MTANTPLTSTQITNLNRSNRAAKDILLGTRTSVDEANLRNSGSWLVTSADASGSLVTINTGLGTAKGFTVQHQTSSGSILPDLYVTNSSGSLLVKARGGIAIASAGSLIANDIITWFAF